MTIASNTDLIQRCQDWLFGRSDIAARVPDFITLFEAKANRSLFCRQMETRAITTIDMGSSEPEFVTLPSDFQTMRRVRLVNTLTPTNGTGAEKPRLRYATGAQIDDLREENPAPGAPIWFSIFGDELELLPTPDQAYSVEMVYRCNIPALGSSSPGGPIATNWLLEVAPDAYLYGTLMEAAPYLHEDERIAVWSAGVTAAFQQLNDLSEKATYDAGPLVMRRRGRGYS